MTTPIFLAVLCGALLHASWNALIKSGRDKELDTALIHSLGFFVALPLLLWTGLPARESWPYIAASTVVHIGYYVALAGAYRHGDLGLTYPVMRGSAPLLVAVAGFLFVDEHLSGWAWLGIAVICAGVLALGMSPAALHAGSTSRRRTALRFAFANAGIIALYTVIDGQGVRVAGDALAYVAALFLFDGLPYFALVMWQRGDRRGAAWRHMAGRWKLCLIGTAASLGSYAIALWAMTQAPVALVAAVRETSVLFAAVIGALLLREPFGWQRAAGTLVIVAGVMTLRIG